MREEPRRLRPMKANGAAGGIGTAFRRHGSDDHRVDMPAHFIG